MSAEQWSEISPCLECALELAADDREQYLVELAAEKPRVAARVREFLVIHEKNDAVKFLESSPLAQNKETVAGEKVGPYTLETLLGSGGMGSVWRARRSDGTFAATVAIKILDLRAPGSSAADQIRREASLLARLSHPNIARVFDAGMRQDGEAYLVLEYVEGERIDRYCEAHAPLLVSRLRLYLQLLEAVKAAHERQIVHRDIKPTNILVTTDGMVKLLDFGVASLQAPATPADMAISHGSVGGLTAGYAAPEQFRGEAVTPASDVYALGVLLHVLITGQHPYGSATSTHTQLARAALSQDPPPASKSVGSKGSRRWVRGDLDAIVAKSMEREAALRYPTAGELAADVTRFLGGVPVLARPQTLVQRGRLMIRRGLGGAPDGGGLRWVPIAVVSLILVLVAGLVITNRAKNAARAVSDESRMAAAPRAAPERSVAVLPFVDMSEKKDHEYFSDGLSEELIDHLAHSPDLKVIARTSSFQFKGKNEDMRSIGSKLGVANLLEGSVRSSGDAIRVTAQLIKVADGTHLLSETYDRKMGDIFKVQDEIAAAVVAALNANLPVPSHAGIGTSNVESYNKILLARYFDLRGTMQDTDRAIATLNEVIKSDPANALAWVTLGSTYYVRAIFNWMPARDAYLKSREAIEHGLTIDPNLARGHRMLALVEDTLNQNHEGYLREMRRALELDPSLANPLDEGIQTYRAANFRDAAQLIQRAADADPLDAWTLTWLAMARYADNDPAKAERAVRQLLAINPDYAGAHCQLGGILLAQNRPTEALEIMAKESDEQSRLLCMPMALWALDRHAEAEAMLAEVWDRYHDSAAYGIAGCYAYMGKKDEAFKWLNVALASHGSMVQFINADPDMRPLYSDPRFNELLAKAKAPE